MAEQGFNWPLVSGPIYEQMLSMLLKYAACLAHSINLVIYQPSLKNEEMLHTEYKFFILLFSIPIIVYVILIA